MNRLTRITLATAATLLSGMEGASAQTLLDKIRETHVITIGHPETSVPFAYLGDQQKPIGYSVEICEQVAAKLQDTLGVGHININYTPTTAKTRIPLISNGTIDLECGNTTNTEERKKFVSFAPTTFVANAVLFARKDSGINVNDVNTLKGKTLVVQAGSIVLQIVSDINRKNSLGLTIVPANDVAQTFLMVETGRADVGATDDALAYAGVAASKEPQSLTVSTTSLSTYPYAIMLPKGDSDYKQAIDDAVNSLIKSGKVAELYQKYFLSPIPPRNINLNFPMSKELEHALAKPTDSSDGTDYRP